MAGVISQGSVNFLLVGCMGLGGKLGSDFWFSGMAKASYLVVQSGSQYRNLSGYRQGARLWGNSPKIPNAPGSLVVCIGAGSQASAGLLCSSHAN